MTIKQSIYLLVVERTMPTTRQAQRLALEQAEEEMKEAEAAPISPNQQTRAKRKELKRPPHSSSLERKRIARICRDFEKEDTKPCSVFGRDRYQRWEDFFFCSNCKDADEQETAFPNTPINRKAENGRFTCTCSHDNIIMPTDTVKVESVKNRPKKRKARRRPRFRKNHRSKKSKGAVPTPVCIPEDQSEALKSPTNDEEGVNTQDKSVSSKEDDDSSVASDDSESTYGIFADSESETTEKEPLTEGVSVLTCSVTNSSTSFSGMTTNQLLSKVQKANAALSSKQQETEMALKNKEMEIQSLKLDIKKVRRQSKKKSRKITKLETRIIELQSSNEERSKLPKRASDKDKGTKIIAHIKVTISNAILRHGKTSDRAERFLRSLCKMFVDGNIHHGMMRDVLVEVVGKHLRNTVFTPFRILSEMDRTGGVLNYEGIEILRRVETNGQKNKHTIIPSTSSLQNCAAMIERYGSIVCPFRMIRNERDSTEGFYFRACDVMRAILQSGGLMDGIAADRPVNLSQSLDGAQLTKHLSHTLGGLKFNDASNPLKQSRNSVFPVVCVIGRETTSIVRGLFARMIQEIDEAATTVLPSQYGIKPPKIATNCNMSCEWKLTGRGGAAKVCKYPCSKCSIASSDLHLQTRLPTECKICMHLKHTDDEEWKCRHVDMCTGEHVALMKEDIDKFKAECPVVAEEIKEIQKKSKIRTDTNPSFPPHDIARTSSDNIHFDIQEADIQDKLEYSRNVNHDLQLRKLSLVGPLSQRQERLRIQLISEWTYQQASLRVKQFGQPGNKDVSGALVMMMDAVPCLLHLENRMGIKILSMCLKSGLTHTKNDEQDWVKEDDRSSIDRKCQAFVEKVEDVINSSILGTPMQPQQWILPYDRRKNLVGTITMDNVKIRKVIQEIDILIDPMIQDSTKKEKWKTCIGHYRQALEIVNRKHDLSNEEIWEFQKQADYFFKLWIELYGAEGVTNYAHVIGSGHLREYLQHWRNLSNHSQQGWEAFNSAFKTYYFSRTQRGGATNKGEGPQSRLKSMARWIQRRMVFLLGISEDEIEETLASNRACDPTEPSTVAQHGGTIEFGQPVGFAVRNQDDVENNEEFEFDWEVALDKRDDTTNKQQDGNRDDDDDDDDAEDFSDWTSDGSI